MGLIATATAKDPQNVINKNVQSLTVLKGGNNIV